MYFVGLGVILLFMKAADFGPVALWSWWAVLWPFGAALLWWWWADASGYTKRKEVEKMDAKRVSRREQNLEALGMDKRGRRHKRRAPP